MADGMAKMIQMISVLSDMQSRRRQLDLQEEQMRTQASQFSRKQGFDEGSEQSRKIEKLLGEIAKTNSAARTPLIELARTMGLDTEQTAALEHYGQNATQSLQSLQEQAAGRGAAQATPASDMEAYLGATSGMNRGQQAASGLQNQVFGAAGQQFTASQQPGAPDALAKAGQQAVFGSMPGWGQFQQADIGKAGVQANIYGTNAQMIADAQRFAAQLASSKATGMLTQDQRIQGIGQMLQIVKDMSAKGKNDASRIADLALYNRLAAMIDPTLVWDNPNEAPNAAGLLERAKQFAVPAGPPGVGPQTQPPQMQQQSMPLQRFQYNYQGPSNPMEPLFGRPYSPFPQR